MPAACQLNAPQSQISELILGILLPYKRSEEHHDHDESSLRRCFSAQLSQIGQFASEGLPIGFTLPAFPCKSPNPDKVLGHLPDMGERASLRFLQRLCEQIEDVYPPGARILICSDGHVFGDLIHVPDHHISQYGDCLGEMIEREGCTSIETFSLEHVYGDLDFDTKRGLLEADFAEPLESLRAEVRSDGEALRLYRGITRFLVEDAHKATYRGSKSALLKDCRERAYGVIRRSRAWSGLISKHHPRSVRLSIHPQPCGSVKLGLMLLDSASNWQTPWHSAAVMGPDGKLTLLKRAEAEQVGELVHVDGRPSHYVAAAIGQAA